MTTLLNISRFEFRLVSERRTARADVLWEQREPMSMYEAKQRHISTEPTLLDVLGVADLSAAKLVKLLPPHYDGYDWWADTLPARPKLRAAVDFAVRRRGFRQISKKLIDKITNAVISRAKARGRRPERHTGSAYCVCNYCDKLDLQILAEIRAEQRAAL